MAYKVTKDPLVSIIIPVYNGANFLSEAIESALEQTYNNTEIIIINDGSSDDNETEKIALSYKKKIRYYKKENGGVASALNMGIRHMRGQYFSWLSHDDVYKKNKLSSQLKLIEKFDKNIIPVSSIEKIDLNSKNIGKSVLYSDCYVLHLNDLLCDFPIHGCSLLIHESIFKNVGYFDENLQYCQDYDLWFRIYFSGFRFVYQKETQIFSREHREQGTRKYHEKQKHEAEIVYRKALSNQTMNQTILFFKVSIYLRFYKGLLDAPNLAKKYASRQSRSNIKYNIIYIINLMYYFIFSNRIRNSIFNLVKKKLFI